MILSNIEIETELEAGHLVIDPRPLQGQYSGAAVDLTLHRELYSLPEEDDTQGQPIDPSNPRFNVSRTIEIWGTRHPIDNGYELKPNKLTIGSTRERVELPLHLAARIEGRSSLARLGILVHATAPTIHPGFQGQLTLEIINSGPFDIILKPGLAIVQLIVERVGLPSTKRANRLTNTPQKASAGYFHA